MAQRAIEGRNVLLRAKLNGDYVPFACSTSLEFYYDTELIPKTTVSSAGFREFAAKIGEWGLSLGTVTHIVPAAGSMYTVFDTLSQQVRKEGLDIEAIFEDGEGNIKTITGHVLIPHTSITSPAEGFSEDTIEFKGSGPFAISTELMTPQENDYDMKDPLEYTATGGETTITFAQLAYRTIAYFGRDGIGKDVIVAGEPTDKQVKFIESTGTFSFPYPLGAGEWILILYK